MVNQSLRNKKVIISAGASGIGWATAKVCLDKGAIVFICDVDKKHLLKAKKHKLNKKKLFVYECDASENLSIENFYVEKTLKVPTLQIYTFSLLILDLNAFQHLLGQLL